MAENGASSIDRPFLGRGRPRRRGFSAAEALFAFVVGLVVATAPPAWAQRGADLRIATVDGVSVDVEAEDAVQARALAIVEGKVEGLERLMRKMTASVHWGRLPEIDPESVDRYVQSFGVGQERLSATRYVADLQITYVPDAVRGLLRRSGVPLPLGEPPAVVVAPVLLSRDVANLWRDGNAWRDAWLDPPDPHALVEVFSPLGDLLDVATLTPEDALALSPRALDQFAVRYGADAVLVAEATPGGGADGAGDLFGETSLEDAFERPPPTLLVRARVDSGFGEFLFEEQFLGGVGQSALALMPTAVARVTEALGDAWKIEQAVRFDRVSTLTVDAPLTGLSSWTGLRKRLDDVPEVRGHELVAISQQKATVLLSYIGDLDRLVDSMERRTLWLREQEGFWTVSLSSLGFGRERVGGGGFVDEDLSPPDLIGDGPPPARPDIAAPDPDPALGREGVAAPSDGGDASLAPSPVEGAADAP